jgi:hypothetical protein
VVEGSGPASDEATETGARQPASPTENQRTKKSIGRQIHRKSSGKSKACLRPHTKQEFIN